MILSVLHFLFSHSYKLFLFPTEHFSISFFLFNHFYFIFHLLISFLFKYPFLSMLIFLPSFLSLYLSLSMNNFYPVPFLGCLHTVCYKFWLWVNCVWHSSRNIFLQNVLALPTDFYLLHVPQRNQYSLLFWAPMNLLLFLNICLSYFQNFVILLLLSLNSTISYVSKKSLKFQLDILL